MSTEVAEGISTEAAPMAPATVEWGDALERAREAEGKAPPADEAKPRGKRDEGGRFVSEDGDKAKAQEPPDDKPPEKPEPDRVAVSERAKFREERRAWRAKQEAAAAEIQQRAAALEAREREAAALLEAHKSRDPMAILKAHGFTKEEWARLTLKKFSDPVEAAKEEVERLRAEMTAKERAAEERAAQAQEQARMAGIMSAARAKLGATHPGLDRSPNVVRAVVAELAADDSLTWDEAVQAVEERVLRPEYEALHARFGRALDAAKPPAPEPPKPAPRRGISPATAHDARGGAPANRSPMPDWNAVVAMAKARGG